MKQLAFAILIFGSITSFAAEEITVIGWNAESGDANPIVVAARIAEIDDCDLWGMCEVQNAAWASAFEQAAEIDEKDIQVWPSRD